MPERERGRDSRQRVTATVPSRVNGSTPQQSASTKEITVHDEPTQGRPQHKVETRERGAASDEKTGCTTRLLAHDCGAISFGGVLAKKTLDGHAPSYDGEAA